MAADPTRRVVLAAAGALPLLVTGCRVDALAAPPKLPGDVVLLRAVISAEELMVARYEAAIRELLGGSNSGSGSGSGSLGSNTNSGSGSNTNSGSGSGELASVLRPLLAQHREHLTQLRSRLIVPAAAAAASAAASAAAPERRPSAPRLPAAPQQAIAYLQTAERDASARLLHQLLAAPASLAQLLASISAAEATHVPVLEAARRPA